MRTNKLQSAGFAAFVLACVLLYFSGAFSQMNFLLQDILCLRSSRPQENIFVIAIDDKSLRELGPWNSWPRSRMAELIELLSADPSSAPAVIGVDVAYFGSSALAEDRALRDAAAKAGNVVFAGELRYAQSLVQLPDGIRRYEHIIEGYSSPYPELAEVSSSGFTNVYMDSDGRIRRSLLRADIDGEICYNFAYEIYRRYAQSIGDKPAEPPTDGAGLWGISYSTMPGGYSSGLSFVDVFEGRVPAELFADSIVIVGAYASGMMDSYYTPLAADQPMFGAEINANMVQALCSRSYRQNLSVPLQGLMLICALLVCRFAAGRGKAAAAAALLLFTVGYLAAGLALCSLGWVLDPLYIPLFCGIYFIYRLIVGYAEEQRIRRRTLETFGRYVSPSVAEHLMQSGESALTQGSEKRHIAVMFVDIRGFTPLSESLSAEQVVEILHDYLTLTASAVFANGGTVDKFIGDATMALFGAPTDLEDYIYKAVKTALDIVANGDRLTASLLEKYGRTVQFGIGVHCGEAVVGSIGASFRMDYTAIGDTVNTAARIESVAGPGQVLVSKEVCAALKGRIEAQFTESRLLKGKAEPVDLYQVTALL